MLSFMMSSADGYHADPGEALDWHNVNHEFSQFALVQLREAGTLVFGRATYEGMAAFWPTPAGEQSDPDVAKAMNTTPKIAPAAAAPPGGTAARSISSSSKPSHRPGPTLWPAATARSSCVVTNQDDQTVAVARPARHAQDHNLRRGRYPNRSG